MPVCCALANGRNAIESRCLFALGDSENTGFSSFGAGLSSSVAFTLVCSSALLSLESPSTRIFVDVVVQKSVASDCEFESDVAEFRLRLKADVEFGMSMGAELGFKLTEDAGLERVKGLKSGPSVMVDVELGPSLRFCAEVLGIKVANTGGLGTIMGYRVGF